jgi:imidazolonepropionase-like amidohydrolase
MRAGRQVAGWAVLGSILMATLAMAADGDVFVLRCGRLIDGTGGLAAGSEAVVVVEGDRIAAVGSDAVVPQGAEGIDLTSSTCLPGLIDAHAHPLIATDDYQVDHLRHSSGYKALRGLQVLQRMLAAGWTSVRIAGDADVHYAHLDVKQAIDEGRFVGPRVTGAGHYLSITGGGGDINFLAPEHQVVADGLVVDGVDEIRKAVRNEVKHGSEWIKVLASGAMMSAGDNPLRTHFSPEELAELVREADRLGVPVMAHAHPAEAIKRAARAGVRSIEHGTFIDAEGIELLKELGVFLVPTLYVGEYYLNEQPDSEAQREFIDIQRRYRDQNNRSIAAAIRAGVEIGVGTDYVGFPVEQGVRELALLVELGMTPMQAIQAATRTNARLLGWEEKVGTIEPGKLADLIAVPGDPLVDLSRLETVSFVMLGGRVVRRSETTSTP